MRCFRNPKHVSNQKRHDWFKGISGLYRVKTKWDFFSLKLKPLALKVLLITVKGGTMFALEWLDAVFGFP